MAAFEVDSVQSFAAWYQNRASSKSFERIIGKISPAGRFGLADE